MRVNNIRECTLVFASGVARDIVDLCHVAEGDPRSAQRAYRAYGISKTGTEIMTACDTNSEVRMSKRKLSERYIHVYEGWFA